MFGEAPDVCPSKTSTRPTKSRQRRSNRARARRTTAFQVIEVSLCPRSIVRQFQALRRGHAFVSGVKQTHDNEPSSPETKDGRKRTNTQIHISLTSTLYFGVRVDVFGVGDFASSPLNPPAKTPVSLGHVRGGFFWPQLFFHSFARVLVKRVATRTKDWDSTPSLPSEGITDLRIRNRW